MLFRSDGPTLVRQWCMESLQFPCWEYYLEVCCIPRKQYILYIKIKLGKELTSMLRNRQEDLFDVMAAYDCQRDEILEKLQKEDWKTLYSSMVSIANRAAFALPNEIQTENGFAEEEAVLAVTFYQNGKFHLAVEEVTSVLSGLKILPKISEKPENTIGDKITFLLTLEGISIYQYNEIQSFGYIVQNENLFPDNGLHIREEFIVTSQEVGTKAIKMLPKYRIKIEEKSVEGAVKQVWDTLRLTEETLQADMEVNFCYDVTDNQIGLQMRMPVTLSLGGESLEELVSHIDTWLKEHGYKLSDGQLEFVVYVYDSMKNKILEAVLEN